MIDAYEERPRLLALAYRMLGSSADAEEVVQEAFAALHGSGARPESPAAWLTTVVTRLSIDRARSAAHRRETYVGPWLPEPIATDAVVTEGDPAERLSALESVSIAFLLVLERLSPLERAVFLLREVFDYDFADVAAAVGRSEAACRQLLHRAKEHVAAARPRFTPARESHQALVLAFLQAARSGDVEGLKTMLTEDVQLTTDGGGKVTAARNVIVGADHVARFTAGVARGAEGLVPSTGWVNGELALLLRNATGTLVSVVVCSLAPEGDRIARIQAVLNPDKLQSFKALGRHTDA